MLALAVDVRDVELFDDELEDDVLNLVDSFCDDDRILFVDNSEYVLD